MAIRTKVVARPWATRLAITAGLLVMAGSHAHATVIDGVTLAPGATKFDLNVFEILITGVGQSLEGVGRVEEIDNSQGIPEYTYGENGVYLTYTFSGFKSSFILAPSKSNDGFIEFTGGIADVYVHSSNPNITNAGSTTKDFTNAQSSKLFLSAAAELFDTNPTVESSKGGPKTTTLEATLPNNSTLAKFSNAFGTAFLDATGGDAFKQLHTCTLSVTPGGGDCPSGFVDALFSEEFSSTVTGNWTVSGDATVKASVVPEPASFALLGAALIGFGGLSRRSRRKG